MKGLMTFCSLLCAVSAFAAPTKVMFFFDTEDFTCDRSNEPIRETARILTEEGVRGEYNIVGYLARELVASNRRDVIEALRPHAIGTQSLRHSVHPTVCERSDMDDWRVAYANVLADEAEGVGMIKAAFGLQHVDYAVPPGNSWSYASLYAFADLGMTFYGGGGFASVGTNGVEASGIVPPGLRRRGLWYCNLYQIPYDYIMALEDLIPDAWPNWTMPDFAKVLDTAARQDGVVFALHPNMVVKREFWDEKNYFKTNLVEWGKWIPAADRPQASVDGFYRNFRAFVRAVKADRRFEITDTIAEKANLKPRVAIRRKDLPAVRAALERDFGAISSPASWCVADVFQAVVGMLRGKESHLPGKVRGFVARPRGVEKPVTVRTVDLESAAGKLDLTAFIPSEIDVGGTSVGPADFLFAALEALVTGAREVTVGPRDQLGSFKNCPSLERVNIKDKWGVHAPTLDGKLLDERLKLQLWTLRFE